MRLTVIGCSGSFPGPDSPASCYLVEAEGFKILLDLGSGALGTLQRYVGLHDVDAIVLSHLHADHCLDLCGYHVVRTYCPSGRPPRLPVFAPSGANERLDRAYGMSDEPVTAESFDFNTLRAGKLELGPFQITTARMNHPIETFGFRVEHAGKALAYSADTGESAALVDLAWEADLLLCEASFAERKELPPGLHLSGRQAGEHAARAGVGRLVVTHMVAWNDRRRTEEEAVGAFCGPVDLASTGATYEFH